MKKIIIAIVALFIMCANCCAEHISLVRPEASDEIIVYSLDNEVYSEIDRYKVTDEFKYGRWYPDAECGYRHPIIIDAIENGVMHMRAQTRYTIRKFEADLNENILTTFDNKNGEWVKGYTMRIHEGTSLWYDMQDKPARIMHYIRCN